MLIAENYFYLPGAFLDLFTNSSLNLLDGEGLQLELDPGLFPGSRVSSDPESPGLSLIGEDKGVEEPIGIPILRIEEQRFRSIRGISRFRGSWISLTFLSVSLEAKTILFFHFRLSELSSEEFILYSRTTFSFFINVIFTSFPSLFSSFLGSSSCSIIGRLFSFLSSVPELEPGDGSSVPGLQPGDGVSSFETWFLVSPICISSSRRISPGAAR